MRKILFLLILLLNTVAFAIPESDVELAWKALQGSGQKQAEEHFKAAIAAEKTNTRAHLGISLLYEMQDRKSEAWDAFKNVLSTEQNFYPYLSAQWLYTWDDKIRTSPTSGMVDLLKRLSEKGNPDGMMKAQACEQLGTHFQHRGDLSAARGWFAKLNAITDWMLTGPFDNISASGFDRVFPPEQAFDATKTYEGKNGIPAQWFAPVSMRVDRWVDFTRYFAFTQSVFYANTFVLSPRKQTAQIRIGTSGSLKAFLNDEEIIQYFDENNNDLDTYIVETELQQGWNRLLIKCGYSEITRCNFMVRITDARGEPLDGVNVSIAGQPYTSRPNAPKRVLENHAEAFFKGQIQRHPAWLENYLLLAQVYLMNDKAIEAELTLREALKRSPNNVLILNKMLEAFVRGEKYDEISQTMEKILTLDPHVPAALLYKIQREIENEDFDNAEESLNTLKKLQPFGENVYRQQIALYRKKKQSEKIADINHEAYGKHPNVWDFVYLESALSQQKTRSTDGASEIVGKYLKDNYTVNALSTLAEYSVSGADLTQWESYYAKMIELEPAAPGYHFRMAKVYSGVQEYTKADKALKQAIAICPNSDAYWAELGEVSRVQKENARAMSAYENALRFNPANYEAREKLRELQGKKSVFAQFAAVNVDSAINAAPKKGDGHGVVLLDDTKRVVFDKGTSMAQHELLVKLFTNTGIDQYKEFGIPYNPYTETLIIEKAATIKADGTEVKADVARNGVVFKQLEEGECMYLRWKTKNYYNGKLSNQFWDENYFNGAYPVLLARYALLIPQDLKFNTKTQGSLDAPTKRTTEDGVLYEWTARNEPPIIFEPDMPPLTDVAKTLYISSIQSWDYLVEWYTDLARTKTRSTFEIREQVQKLLDGKQNISEMEKIRIVYDFITENIRYSSVPFRQSPLVPQDARDVLINRIGDCKDVATLCIAMLREAGITAHHVLVNTSDQGSNANILPTIAFNHAIAAVETKQGLLYLDLTANNFPFGSAPEPDVDAFTLLIKPSVNTPAYLTKQHFSPNNISRSTIITLASDNSITVKHTAKRTGSESAGVRYFYRDRSPEDRQKIYAQGLAKDFPNMTLKRLQFSGLDSLSSSVTTESEFEVRDYVGESGKFRFLKLPWADKLEPDEALSSDKRIYPLVLHSREDTLREQITVKLPKGIVVEELPKRTRFTGSAADHSITYTLSGNSLVATRLSVRKKNRIEPEEYTAYKKFYNDALREDEKQLVLRKR